MSNRSLTAIVASFGVLLAFPLIVQAFKSSPAPKMDDASQAPRVAEDTAQAVPATVAPLQPAPRQPSVMTETQFSQIVSGMAYAQCVEFIGSEGKPSGRDPGGNLRYSWQLVNGTSCTGEATLTFQNGILCGKGFSRNQGRRAFQPMNMSTALPAQPPAAPPYICRSVNNRIKNGCDYAECVRLLAMEGTYLGRTAASAGTRAPDGTMVPAMVDVYAWHNPAIPATLTLSFRDGKLTAREVSVGRGTAAGFGGHR